MVYLIGLSCEPCYGLHLILEYAVLSVVHCHQQWECQREPNGKLRIVKCRSHKEQNDVAPSQAKCKCPGMKATPYIDKDEKRLQRHFLRTHVSQRESCVNMTVISMFVIAAKRESYV